MALFSINNITISGIASCVPKTEYCNKNYTWISEKERQLLIKTTGVEKRRIASKGQTTSDFCFHAAQELLDKLKWNPNDIELLVFVSQSRDYQVPCTSTILQHRLNLPQSTVVFDLPLGCSGYVYGLATIASLMKSTQVKKALLLVGDISTFYTSYKDKSTYPLFGDAGSCTALELTELASPIHFNLQTDGSGYDAIIIPDGGLKHFPSKKSFDIKKYPGGIYKSRINLVLDGIKVFNFAINKVPPNINNLIKSYAGNLENFDYYVLHQANLLINETIRKKLKLAKEKVPYSIQNFGNTSSASIPLTMVTRIREALENKKLQLLLCGFGIGFSWGSVAVETENIVCPELIEI